MSSPLRVLIVEDSASDAALVVRLLGKAGYDVYDERVEDAGQMQAALDRQDWDVVIADYRLPEFDAPAALALLQQIGLDIPFIVVSGTVGEETAVAMMKAGAHDYLLKDKLLRLAPAVEREIREAHTRRERWRVEEALRHSEAFLDNVIEHSPHSMWISDDKGVLIRLNQACRDLLHIRDDEVVGKYNVLQDNIVEEQGCMPLVRQMFEYGELVQFSLRYDSSRLKLLKLEEPAFVILDVTISPVLDAKGRVTNAIIQHVDITERKRAEEELTASEIRYRRLFEAARDGILILDAETGMIVDVNPFLNELLGLSHEVLVEKKIWELGFFKDIIANQAKFAELQQREYIRYEDIPLETTDGRRIDVEFISNVYLVNHKKVIQCNIRDITERKRAVDKIRQQLEELQRWHDLTLDRETRSLELKREVNELLRRLSQPIRYPSVEA